MTLAAVESCLPFSWRYLGAANGKIGKALGNDQTAGIEIAPVEDDRGFQLFFDAGKIRIAKLFMSGEILIP